MELDTLAVHAGRGDVARLGVHAPPLDLSTTYPLPDLEAAVAAVDTLAAGGASATSPVYARVHNPTVHRVEQALAELDGAEEAVCFASGMAAFTATLLATCVERRHVIALRPLYGGSDHLLVSGLLGLDVDWVAGVEDIAAAVRPETGLVVLETPQNPTLGQVDIEATVAAAGDVPVLVDNTFATPVLQQPLRHGAAYALQSATKFLGGHGDVIAGVVSCRAERAATLRQIRIVTGGILHPLAAYLLHRSLPTLPFRVRAAQERARVLAGRLEGHPAVTRVYYPVADGRQLQGPGSVLSFDLEGGFDAAAAVMASVSLITPAVSLGCVDTLIEHPAGLTHRVVSEEARAASGVGEGLLRLSVGLEDAGDLWHDLEHALATVPEPAGRIR